MIDNILNTLYQKLDAYFNNQNTVCMLNQNVNVSIDDCLTCQSKEYYDSIKIDYSCDIKKNIYMLRYMVVHCTEIISILDTININHFKRKEPLNILTIGGGSRIDILAFNEWISEKLGYLPQINYTVIDKEDWGNNFDILTSGYSSSINFRNEYVGEDTILEDEYDLVMMSYLISELNQDTRNIIWNKIYSNKIILINDRSENNVIESLKNFRDDVSDSSYKCFDDVHCGFTFPDVIYDNMQPKIYKKSCGCVYYNDN